MKAAKDLVEVIQKIKQRKSILQRIRDRFRSKSQIKKLREKMEITEKVEEGEKKRKRFRLFNRESGFFSPERIKKRREFRVKVSHNRKWIMIGVAVVAVCGTIIYLSVTYGGGGISNLIKMLGAFR